MLETVFNLFLNSYGVYVLPIFAAGISSFFTNDLTTQIYIFSLSTILFSFIFSSSQLLALGLLAVVVATFLKLVGV